MALTPQQIALRDLDGDEAEQVAWKILEWVALVDNLVERQGVLGAYSQCLASSRPSPVEQAASASGVQRKIAFKLLHMIAGLEGRSFGQRNQGDRDWILSTYDECLEAVQGRRAAAT